MRTSFSVCFEPMTDTIFVNSFSRVFLAILSRKLKKKLGIDFKINKLGLFQLKNVTIEKNDQFLVVSNKIQTKE